MGHTGPGWEVASLAQCGQLFLQPGPLQPWATLPQRWLHGRGVSEPWHCAGRGRPSPVVRLQQWMLGANVPTCTQSPGHRTLTSQHTDPTWDPGADTCRKAPGRRGEGTGWRWEAWPGKLGGLDSPAATHRCDTGWGVGLEGQRRPTPAWERPRFTATQKPQRTRPTSHPGEPLPAAATPEQAGCDHTVAGPQGVTGDRLPHFRRRSQRFGWLPPATSPAWAVAEGLPAGQ